MIARELGLKIEMNDVACESMMPSELEAWEPDTHDGAPPLAVQLATALKPHDAAVEARVKTATEAGKVLVPVARVCTQSGIAQVVLEELEPSSRLARGEGNDNVIAIHSARYTPQPLVIQGPGAGAEITASGLFADLLSLTRSVVEWTLPRSFC